ncbi:hypothetical protein G6L37_04435 [Agrobacterium rubi]|nr:hypothetical protein [Agrobacterium rubi]NTF24600.1 hypothetical protein [Agrobacterium rubi]
MVFVPMKKDSAILTFGSSWSVDHEARRIVETLGDMRPTFFFGTLHSTLEKAWEEEATAASDVRDYDVVPLPATLRVPIRLPIPGGRSLDERHPPGRAWVLHSGDLLAKGLRIEQRAIVKVGFKKAPASLEDVCDVVASWVWLDGDRKMRIGVDYDDTGRISSDGSASIETGDGSFEAMPTAMVYFSEREAVEAVNILAAQLVEASYWRKHSNWVVEEDEDVELAAA